MKNIDLARKILNGIDDRSFECDMSAYEDGACGGGWVYLGGVCSPPLGSWEEDFVVRR
jgi:hypothetical protein